MRVYMHVCEAMMSRRGNATMGSVQACVNVGFSTAHVAPTKP